MKLYILLSLVILTSCATYNNLYEVSASSKSVNVNKVCEYEDETVKISYMFWGEGGNMAFSVFNKLSTPIYIDWKKSSLVRNNQKSDYWVDEVNSKSKSKSNSFGYTNTNLYMGVLNFNSLNSQSSVSFSNSIRPERVTFLAPKSYVSRVYSHLFTLTAQEIEKNATKSKLETPYENANIPVKYQSFTNLTTPFTFRNFLTISTTEKFDKEQYIDNEFFVTRIYKIKRDYFDAIFTYNPESKKKELIHVIPDPRRFYIQL